MPLDSQLGQEEARVPITANAIPAISRQIAMLDPGAAAALRRGPLAGPGAAAYWKLLAEYHSPGARRETAWAEVGRGLQAIAVLTPKGRDGNKETAHLPGKPMGATLSDAGVSELRVARLLSQPRDRRGAATVADLSAFGWYRALSFRPSDTLTKGGGHEVSNYGNLFLFRHLRVF